MRRIVNILAFAMVFSAFAVAETWSGALLDASCYSQQMQKSQDRAQAVDACPATGRTASFALFAQETVYQFDANGNSLARTAMSNRADRSLPGEQQASKIMANVEGTESSGTIQVEGIQVP